METSPPVRDVSERNRANRNRCIVVAVTSVVILVAVVVIIAYITHFSSTELTPSSANSIIDKSLLRLKNDSVAICSTTYEINLKENDTYFLERLGDCSEAPLTREDLQKRNDTSYDEQPLRSNVICKLTASNVRIVSLANATRSITKDCKFNLTIEVDFALNEDNQVDDIVFRASSEGKSPWNIIEGIVGTVRDQLEENVLSLASEYCAANTTVQRIDPDWSKICRAAPWGC